MQLLHIPYPNLTLDPVSIHLPVPASGCLSDCVLPMAFYVMCSSPNAKSSQGLPTRRPTNHLNGFTPISFILVTARMNHNCSVMTDDPDHSAIVLGSVEILIYLTEGKFVID